MKLKTINIERDFDACIAARKDAYLCSFGTLNGVERILSGYRERIMARLTDTRFYQYHVWNDDQIIGQIEFCSFRDSVPSKAVGWNSHETGYLYLIYLIPEYRGSGIVHDLHDTITSTLSQCGCKRILLSVSTTNERAMCFYKKKGWRYFARNDKHATTNYMLLEL